MASDQQVALARNFGSSSTNLSKATRQVVPPFLQKLYEMVSDPTSDELIKWSGSGDSFFVFDQERFAREVLGRWFKHNKFTSFVRQLNMYGFHKIPHLQQGVLKSENETEMWNFEHPNFHRGQPDLLCLIQRKKAPEKAGGPGDDGDDGGSGGSGITGTPTAGSSLTSGQLIDINSIVNGITAIKRHQTAISSDLNELKNSNTHLWQEAIAARERHKKHQDTINRILKFLAGVFGQNGTRRSDSPGPVSAIPRKRQRLMIEDAQRKDGQDWGLYEMDDGGSAEISQLESPTRETPPTELFVAADTPTSARAIHNITTPVVQKTATESGAPVTPAIPPPAPILPSELEAAAGDSGANTQLSDARNSLSPIPSPQASEAALQAAFSNMLESTQLQKLMAALQAQPAFQMPSDVNIPSYNLTTATATSLPPFSGELGKGGTDSLTFSPEDRSSSSLALGQADEIANFEPLLDSTDHLEKTVKDAEAIGQEMNGLESSINSLIESLGLDPNVLQTGSNPPPADSIGTVAGTVGDLGEPTMDFDFESFLRDYAGADGPPYTVDDPLFDTSMTHDTLGENDSSAFLDEVVSNASTASPAQRTQALPSDGQRISPSHKRKSDHLDPSTANGHSPSRMKRKR